ncbi:MAG TPA: protein phosphatase 2C domain-containing protein [Gammaproteobacteria bacterium]|nr:protein phosphatase 2C domain-containing protein [Gammaproteobacteria bacterium]
MSWHSSMASDIGGRKEQQDCLDKLSVNGNDSHLFIVADGMGGHRDGALAARTVIETARQRLTDEQLADPRAFLKSLCLESHQAINELGGDGERSPGSTCILLYVNGPEAYWAHVGDSRLYHFRNGELLNRTQDHSVAQLMVDRGQLDEADVAGNALQNQLYMRLGGDKTPQPEFGASEIEANDTFMLCSDGFWAYITPEEAVSILERLPPDEDGAAHLVALARERGGGSGDNISLALTRWIPEKSAAGKGMLSKLRSFFCL